MRRKNRPFALLTLPFLMLACGGSDAADDAGSEMAETAAAPPAAASASGLSCNVMGDAEGRASPLEELSFTYDGGEGLLCYGAPSANGREIMGGLVPFGQPWRLGANEPTTIHLSAATTIGGVSVEAGTYSIYAIPGESEWEFFVNTNADRWGIPINDEVRATEIGSFRASAESVADMVETMTFGHMGNALSLSWENTRLDIPIGM
ncbi:MAG: DUF2911 domain-containing protein [Gemmatimonadetes bacterium]|nr:DUF2911 domain-containing protein [Gemmatimonadota bacterium]